MIKNNHYHTLLRSFVKFSVTGILNTGIHAFLLWAIVQSQYVSNAVANVIAFSCANLFSYLMNSIWSFGSKISGSKYIRFLMISIVGVIFSYLIMRVGDYFGFYYMISFLIQIAVMTPLNFLFLKLFVFPEKVNHR